MIEKCQSRIQSEINNRLVRIRILLRIYSLLPSSLFNSFPLFAFALISILLSNFPQISVLPFSLFSFIIYSTISHITFLSLLLHSLFNCFPAMPLTFYLFLSFQSLCSLLYHRIIVPTNTTHTAPHKTANTKLQNLIESLQYDRNISISIFQNILPIISQDAAH